MDEPPMHGLTWDTNPLQTQPKPPPCIERGSGTRAGQSSRASAGAFISTPLGKVEGSIPIAVDTHLCSLPATIPQFYVPV